MSQSMVIVRNKKDRSDVREMTELMYRVVQDDFDIVQNGQSETDPNDKTAEAIKKKLAAKGAVDNKEFIIEVLSTGLNQEQVSELSTEFATISEEPEEDNTVSLAFIYESKAGKAPDKRWKAARIQSEIDKLNK